MNSEVNSSSGIIRSEARSIVECTDVGRWATRPPCHKRLMGLTWMVLKTMIFNGKEFFRWYLTALLYWMAGEIIVSIAVRLFSKASFESLVVALALWFAPALLSLPVIYYSWLLTDRPKLRAFVFSLSVMLLSLGCILATRVSWVRIGLSSQEFAHDLVPVGVVGAFLTSVSAYILCLLKFTRRADK
jgi:cytochrome bd-type quinol oxidase subunit 2